MSFLFETHCLCCCLPNHCLCSVFVSPLPSFTTPSLFVSHFFLLNTNTSNLSSHFTSPYLSHHNFVSHFTFFLLNPIHRIFHLIPYLLSSLTSPCLSHHYFTSPITVREDASNATSTRKESEGSPKSIGRLTVTLSMA